MLYAYLLFFVNSNHAFDDSLLSDSDPLSNTSSVPLFRGYAQRAAPTSSEICTMIQSLCQEHPLPSFGESYMPCFSPFSKEAGAGGYLKAMDDSRRGIVFIYSRIFHLLQHAYSSPTQYTRRKTWHLHLPLNLLMTAQARLAIFLVVAHALAVVVAKWYVNVRMQWMVYC
jgi:hypothetical protein